MSEQCNALFQPMKIGNVEIKNRIVMCAMGGPSAMKPDGTFNEQYGRFYVERAKGGTGLIIPSVTHLVDMFGMGNWFHNYGDRFVEPMKKVMEEIHSCDAKLFLQITAGMGRVLQINTKMIKSQKMNPENALIAPCKIHNVWNKDIMHREMTKEEIHERVEAFGKLAKMCKDAGIDGVEVHAVHEGYLLDQFAISAMNTRTDEYGGSLENRLRFTCEIIQEIKRVCGKDYPVTVRYSVASKMKGWNQGALPGEDYKEFGRSLEESPKAAQILEAAGCDALNADNGTYDSWYYPHPPVYMPLACNLPECEYIKNFVNIPVICAGRMHDPISASEAVASGKIDAIGLARPLLADPQWPNKAQAGDLDNIRPCISCHVGCMGEVLGGRHLSCALNPAVMEEDNCRIGKTDHPKNIIIVGGGIGGMEAARIADLRGHHVTLFKKTDKLGGAFIAAAAMDFKEMDRSLLNWYRTQMKNSNVDIRMNTVADQETIAAMNPDEVIIAVGASEKSLPIKGFEHTVTAVDVLRERVTPGKDVAIIGGGLTGCELSCQLAKHGHTVPVVEALDDILSAPGIMPPNRAALVDYMNLYQVRTVCGAQIEEILPDGLVLKGGQKISADTVISAVGYNPNPFNLSLGENVPVHVIGDAAEVGNLMTVIHGAFKLAYEI